MTSIANSCGVKARSRRETLRRRLTKFLGVPLSASRAKPCLMKPIGLSQQPVTDLLSFLSPCYWLCRALYDEA